ncbi:hypothetical protein GCM10011495_03610 [Hymenobacter frigidus]|uniref:Uncharacterized protein n=1 Tax=Hymenobacter frigidus TaxID=1524095 RepID=A0ABQ1ZVF6_9BACT|nr:hypothetical protein GCM10011495_03610 [Hymenobacter frigidus]
MLKIPASYGTPALKIFSRWGRLVYETSAYRNDWTGTNQPAGTYYWSNNLISLAIVKPRHVRLLAHGSPGLPSSPAAF